jgi:hypothetical protein
MLALEVFTIYVTPFLILGAVLRLIMKRHAVDQSGLTSAPRLPQDPGHKTRRLSDLRCKAPVYHSGNAAGESFSEGLLAANPENAPVNSPVPANGVGQQVALPEDDKGHVECD